MESLHLRPVSQLRVGRLSIPIRLSFGAAAEIHNRTGVDWLSGSGILAAVDDDLPRVLRTLATAAVGRAAPSLLRIRLALVGERAQARVALWLNLAALLYADLPVQDEDDAAGAAKPKREEVPAAERLEVLWMTSRVRLGLPLDDFWELTPREFFQLARRANEADERAQQVNDYGWAVVASLIYNSNRGSDAPALRPADFAPSLKSLVREVENDDGEDEGPEGAPSAADLAKAALEGLERMKQ